MLHEHVHLVIEDGKVLNPEFGLTVSSLKDGDYVALIMDDTKNRSLPQMKYLFGVVLRAVSDTLPEHPSVDALYRYFERLYAPSHVCNLPGGQRFEYRNLKSEKAIEVNKVVERIVHHITTEWGIDILPRKKVTAPEAKELWAGAYTEQWNLPLSN